MNDVLLRFIHISDTHFAPEGHTHDYANYAPEVIAIIEEARAGRPERHMVNVLDANRQLVAALNQIQEPIDFVLHTGDVNTDPLGPEHYEVTRDILKDLRFPLHILPGNHDNVRDLQTVLLGMETSSIPHDYTFEMNGVQVVCVDTASHGANHGGRLSLEQINWLKEQTNPADTRPLVVAIHHPMLKFGHKLIDFFGTSNGDEVHEVFKAALPRLRGVFFGHIHMAFDMYVDGVLYSSVPSPSVEVGQPTGYSIVTVKSTGTHIRHVSLPLA